MHSPQLTERKVSVHFDLLPSFDNGPSWLIVPEPVAISPAASERGGPSPDIVISSPPEYDLPSYRLNLKPPRPRTGQSVLIHPPKGSLLPPIRIRHRKPVEHYIPEFPQPRQDSWRPAERPHRPTRRRRTYFWPPPNGDPLHHDSFLTLPINKDSAGVPQGSQHGFWFVPVTTELPSIDSVLEHGRDRPPQRRHVSWLLEAMGVPIPSDSDSETSDSPGTSKSNSPGQFMYEFIAKQRFGDSPSNEPPAARSAGTSEYLSSSEQSATEDRSPGAIISTDGAGFGESPPSMSRPSVSVPKPPPDRPESRPSMSRPPLERSESRSSVSSTKLARLPEVVEARPKLIRSESGPGGRTITLGKLPHIAKVQRPKSSSNPLPPGVIRPLSRPSVSGSSKSRKTSTATRLLGSQLRSQSSSVATGQKVVRPLRKFKAYSARPFHQLIHSGRKKDWTSPVPTDPPGPEDIEVPYVEKFRVDSTVLLPSVLKIFEDEPRPTQTKGKGIVADSSSGAGINPEYNFDDRNRNVKPKARRKSRVAARSLDQDGSTSEPELAGPSNFGKGGQQSSEADTKQEIGFTEAEYLPPAIASSGQNQNRKPKKTKIKVSQLEVKQEDNDYKPRGASLDLEPIPENRPLKLPRSRSRGDIEPEKVDLDPNDPLITWYFPRRSPDYWEMLDDVAKMFEDLQLQEVTLKHFQRPIDYVTVLLCLSNVVFTEMFQTLQEKVTDGQYRIEFVTNGRTGVNLYLSAYSREHIYIAKSLMHKVNVQLDLAKKHSPRSTIQYIHLIECVERGLVHDKRKSWGRVPDGQYSTWTDIESPAVIHEVGIAESRAELYRRCKRYLQDVASVNLVVAIKVDSTECEWAELLVLARDPSDNQICKVFNWVRFWGEGAVNGGELRYYPSDFLEVEDRWKIPRAHMRPLDILDGPRCPIVKVSFGELGRMVSLAQWENQALMGYIKKPYPWPAGYGGLSHMERVSLEGEQPKKTPDFARTLAIASALSDHEWVEPYVAEEWRAEAKRELDELVAQQDEADAGGGGGRAGDDAGSSVYGSDVEDEEDEEPPPPHVGLESVAEEEDDETPSPSGDDKPVVWPKGVVGLI